MRRAPAGPRRVRVVLVRHGPAEDRDPRKWPDDDRRPLTPKGRRETKAASDGVARLAGPVDRIVTSAADRALATARILQASLDHKVHMETWEELGSGRLAQPILDRLRSSTRSGEEVVLVGHEPTLAEFVGLALSGNGQSLVHLAKGGAACLEFPAALRPAGARLLWLLTRKQLADVRD